MPDTSLIDHLRSPFEPADLRNWDGAVSRAERNASIWLYDAIVSGNTNLVRAMLEAGAKVNTALYGSALPLDSLPRSPLGLAWWMQSHGPSGEEKSPEGPWSGKDVLPDNGMVPLLLDAGARPDPGLLRSVRLARWSTSRQPTFVRLERAILGLLHPIPDPEGEAQAITAMVLTHQGLLLNESVVPDNPDHGAHLWLHRAIVREDWAALDGWLNRNGVISTHGMAPVMALLLQPLLQASPVTPSRRAAIGAVRQRLLMEPEPLFRREVIELLLQQDRASEGPIHQGPDTARAAVEAWTLDLLSERSLASFHLQPMDRALLTDEQAARLQQRLVRAEQHLLRAPLAAGPSLTTGTASRSRL